MLVVKGFPPRLFERPTHIHILTHHNAVTSPQARHTHVGERGGGIEEKEKEANVVVVHLRTVNTNISYILQAAMKTVTQWILSEEIVLCKTVECSRITNT